jgi:hypothetical protein
MGRWTEDGKFFGGRIFLAPFFRGNGAMAGASCSGFFLGFNLFYFWKQFIEIWVFVFGVFIWEDLNGIIFTYFIKFNI